ncbi:hypothetical protein [Roseateles sp.]|uniref:hypothetical protein n=1 Tax=Roseateles sp. TaxID=1971397 RepID=UPI0025CD76D1|nr:hypothetical protein [Roseateles sp.]MBV8034719.1 hypothetical protein [Roseateles sp.]
MDHRWIARTGVAALHLGLLALLWLHRPPPLEHPGELRLTTVRLVPLQQRPPPPAPPAATTPRLPAPELSLPAPPAFSSDSPSPAAASPAPAAAADGSAAEPPRTTLRLTLPPGYAASAGVRSAALNDPRSNTVRRTLEGQIANAAALTGDWVEERTSDNRIRRRRGDTCVETEESRIATIDRFNENVAPRATKMTGQPYKCQ